MHILVHKAVAGYEEPQAVLRTPHRYQDGEHVVDMKFTHVGPSADRKHIIVEAEYTHAENDDEPVKRHRVFRTPLLKAYLDGRTPRAVNLF